MSVEFDNWLDEIGIDKGETEPNRMKVLQAIWKKIEEIKE